MSALTRRRFGIKLSFAPRLALASLFLVCAAPAAAAGDDPAFHLKDTDPRAGRPSAQSKLPFDKRYDELTPAQKAEVKSAYEAMAPDDEPPFPVDGLGSVFRAVLKIRRTWTYDGLLRMAVNVDPQGTPRSVAVFKALDDNTTHTVALILLATKFKPAQCAGKPCAMDFLFEVDFGRQTGTQRHVSRVRAVGAGLQPRCRARRIPGNSAVFPSAHGQVGRKHPIIQGFPLSESAGHGAHVASDDTDGITSR